MKLNKKNIDWKIIIEKKKAKQSTISINSVLWGV
jgi:hypothetical protein